MNHFFKKITALILMVTLTFLAPFATYPTITYATELGDVNSSGTVDASDALTVLKHVVKIAAISDELLKTADVTGDGTIDANDALEILQYAVKLIPVLSATELTPELAIQILKEHMKTIGRKNDYGSYFLEDTFSDNSNPSYTIDVDTQIAFGEKEDHLAFALTYFQKMHEEDLDFKAMSRLIIEDGIAEVCLYIFYLDKEGNVLLNNDLITYFPIDSVTSDYTFTHEIVYPPSLTELDETTTLLADSFVHLTLAGYSDVLNHHFNLSLQDIGFTNYKTPIE